jgi:hypothetical protein
MMDLKRLPDWRARLAATLAIDPGKQFAWGSHDCFLGLVAPAVEAITGVDIGAEFRGTYDSPEGARAALEAAGFSDLAEAVASDFPEIPPARMHIGDIAVIPSESEGLGVGLGVVIGERIVALSPTGQGTVRLSRATRAFRVG